MTSKTRVEIIEAISDAGPRNAPTERLFANGKYYEALKMSPFSKQRAMAHQLGLRAARRMALQSATIPADQVDETYYQEVEILAKAVEIAAGNFAIQCDSTRSHFEAVVSDALDAETDRILSLIAKGSVSRH